MVVEASPSSAFVMPESQFLLQILVVALDTPAHVRLGDQFFQCNVSRKGPQEVLQWVSVSRWPLDE
jgi:spore cortex formation protein SpoVR/YcgB (stage V sporulation)